MPLNLALPKGRMYDGVVRLLGDAGIAVRTSPRGYRPTVSLPDVDTKVLKPQSVVEMVDAGTRDLGFAGADWVAELDATNLVDVLDTGLDPVRLVAAAPVELLVDGALPERPLRVASEYALLAQGWMRPGDRFVRSWGATEVLPPEDADCIIDNTATGSTLRANGLQIVDELMVSSTRLVASRRAMDDPALRSRIEQLAMMLSAVVQARSRVMVEVNVRGDGLQELLEALPSMRVPTVAELAGS
ncbi:MAG: ATP phosphoribosyltransferase [Myxococcales bacterium]|nr:ATP phosphoribosyltransferase [Myxococcales bacterium]